MGQRAARTRPQITPITGDALTAALAAAEKPVLLFCHQKNDEVCEFNALVIESFAREKGDEFTIHSLDTQDNAATASRLSLPDGALLLLIRNAHILGYKRGKINAARLDEWVAGAIARKDEDSVPLKEFLEKIERKQTSQQQQEQGGVRKARLLHGAMAAAQLAGGLLLAASFAVPGFGLAGCAIAACGALRGYKILSSPERPRPPQSLPGKIIDGVMNAASWTGSFGLIGLAYGTMGGAAFYATMATALVMLGQSSAGLGRMLPSGLLIGSLRRDAEEIARRDPTKPLDEFSPSAPQEIFEHAPQSAPDNDKAHAAFRGAALAAQDEKQPPSRPQPPRPPSPAP